MIDELKIRAPHMLDFAGLYDAALDSVTTDFKSAVISFVDESRQTPIKDTRAPYSPIRITNEQDFENLVEAIYSIRCNLFHGG